MTNFERKLEALEKRVAALEREMRPLVVRYAADALQVPQVPQQPMWTVPVVHCENRKETTA